MDIERMLTDLAAESDELDRMVSPLPAEAWLTPTPAVGWTIAHQIAHLHWTDRAAVVAVTDPETFQTEWLAKAFEPGFVDQGAERGVTIPPDQVLAEWRTGRDQVAKALRGLPPGHKVTWFGPPMQATSMATARLMETWAHAQDVADTLGVRREPTARLRHVAHLAVRARDYAYAANGRTPPADEFRVELVAPDGEIWTWGPADAAQRVTGPALDFCLLSTQRRHRADTALTTVGPDADSWLGLIQSFAGPAGDGRQPGQFG